MNNNNNSETEIILNFDDVESRVFKTAIIVSQNSKFYSQKQ